MRQPLFLLLFLLSLNLLSAQNLILPSKPEIIADMKLVNDYWISQNQSPGNNQWARAAYFTGNMDFYKIYPDQAYYDYASNWAQNFNWQLNSGTSTTNADNQCVGQIYIDLYNLDEQKSEHKISDINTSINNMIENNNTEAWWWVDALYMAMPIFARLGVIYEDPAYFDQMYELYSNTKYTRGLYNESEGLWYRDESFAAPDYLTPNGEDSYWSRGNGWVIGAHVRVLQVLPETDSHRDEYITTFQSMAAALAERQREDGFWNVSLDDPNDYGGPETSGTSFFIYGIAWGINNGLLDSATYYPVVQKAWEGLTSTALSENGFLGYIQGIGTNPSSSQPVTEASNADFGVGAFLLAGSELAKLAQGEIPEPPFELKSISVLDFNHLKIDFNENLDEASATAISNYAISENIEVIQASIDESDSSVVELEISELSFGSYDLTIQMIQNKAHDKSISTATHTFHFAGAVVHSYSSYQSGSDNVPENTLDFDVNSRWSAESWVFNNQRGGQHILYDLGEIRRIDSVEIAFYQGNQRNSYFYVNQYLEPPGSSISLDQDNYFTSSGATLDLESFDVNDALARYLMYYGQGNSINGWNSLTEVRIHSSELQPPTNISLSIANSGDFIGTLSCADVDIALGDQFEYSLISGIGDDNNNSFFIANDSLFALTPLDRTLDSTYAVRIEVKDLGNNTHSQSLNVFIPKHPKGPTDLTLSNNNISENAPANTIIGVFEAFSETEGNDYTFRLASGEGDDDNESFQISNAFLISKEVYDYESQSQYSIRVEVEDQEKNSYSKKFEIIILDKEGDHLLPKIEDDPNLSIFPNPAVDQDIQVITNGEKPVGYQLIGINGSVIIDQELTQNSFVISKEQLPSSGLYTLRIYTSSGPLLQGKFIVK